MYRLSVLRLHDFVEYPCLVIDQLCELVDGILFVISSTTAPELISLAEKCPKAREIWRDDERWSNGPSLDRAFRHVDSALGLSPGDISLYTDHDELLPDRYAECVEAWTRSDRPLAAFQFLFTWADVEHVVAPQVPIKCWWHGKAVRWRPGISFLPYRGCCMPNGVWPIFRAPYPLRHLCFTTAEMRRKRLACPRRRRHDRAWIEAADNPTLPYDPNMTFTAFRSLAKGATT